MRTALAFTGLVLLAGCGSYYYPTGSYVPGSPATVWMRTGFGVGRQCSPVDFEPEFEAKKERIGVELAEAGVHVHERVVRGAPTCRGCEICAALRAWYYARIDANQEDRAKPLGFVLSEPPPANQEGMHGR